MPVLCADSCVMLSLLSLTSRRFHTLLKSRCIMATLKNPEATRRLLLTTPRVSIKSVQGKTFGYEDSLPNLKVPNLETTIERYLDSVKAGEAGLWVLVVPKMHACTLGKFHVDDVLIHLGFSSQYRFSFERLYHQMAVATTL